LSCKLVVYYTEVMKQGGSCLCLKVTSFLSLCLGLIGHRGYDWP